MIRFAPRDGSLLSAREEAEDDPNISLRFAESIFDIAQIETILMTPATFGCQLAEPWPPPLSNDTTNTG